jgi:glutaredoxin
MRVLALLFLLTSQLSLAAEIKVYTKSGCPYCKKAEKFFDRWQKQNPQHEVKFLDVWWEEDYLKELKAFARKNNIERVSVPLIRVGERYHIGFGEEAKMREKIKELLGEEAKVLAEREVELPLIGKINVKKYGPVALTVIIGLIDGFNPCAMWVLLILLSLLVHLKDRKKMFMIAGIFVLVSGIVYFLFMSSWLLIYDFLDWGRPMQVLVASVALLIGLVHMKDFVAFGKGISFSIPDAMKPKIVKKAREIIQAKTTWISITSVIGLAIFVNFIELMCTAGLPALYTKILQDNGIIGVQRIFYLLSYTFFYMFDDGIMVFIAVWTLSQKRLQESGGKWLKLLSGLTLVILSVLMLFFPDALTF